MIDQTTSLHSRGFDQGFFQNLTWNIGHGRGFVTDLVPGNSLAVHFSPILVVPAVIEMVWSDPLVLSIMNSGALAAVGPATYIFLRALWPATRPARILAAAVAVALPLAPFIQLANQANFHPDAFALSLALLAAAAGLSGRRIALWILAALVISVKEDQAYTMAVVGLLIWRARGPLSADGRLLAVLSCAWGLMAFFVVIPVIGRATTLGPVHLVTDAYYSWLEHASPVMIFNAILSLEPWGRLALLILGLGGLPLLRPAWLLLIAPPFLATLLSAHHAQALLHNHYGLVLGVPALVAAGVGGRRLLESSGPRLSRLSTALLALACGISVGTGTLVAQLQSVDRTSPLAALQACMVTIPSNAPIAADDNLIAPLASRPHIQLIDQALPSDYVVVDTAATPPGWVNLDMRRQVMSTLPLRLRICSSGSISAWAPISSTAN